MTTTGSSPGLLPGLFSLPWQALGVAHSKERRDPHHDPDRDPGAVRSSREGRSACDEGGPPTRSTVAGVDRDPRPGGRAPGARATSRSTLDALNHLHSPRRAPRRSAAVLLHDLLQPTPAVVTRTHPA